jgi:amidase
MLASMVMDLEVSQVVDPRKTVRVRLPRNLIETKRLLEALKYGK